MSFVDPASDWYSASVPVIIYVISYNNGPRYNGTRLYHHIISVTHMKVGHPYIKSMDVRCSNELLGRDNWPNDDHQNGILDYTHKAYGSTMQFSNNEPITNCQQSCYLIFLVLTLENSRCTWSMLGLVMLWSPLPPGYRKSHHWISIIKWSLAFTGEKLNCLQHLIPWNESYIDGLA